MSNYDELRSIHAKLISDNGWSAMQSVKHISEILGRSESTVWNWLSSGNKPIPDHMLKLLKLS